MTSAAEREGAVGDWLSAIGSVGCCLLLLAGCGSAPAVGPTVAQISGPTMGTTYRAAFVVEADYQSRETDYDAIVERLSLVNRQMSTYDSKSELSEFNESETQDWFPVSGQTSRVVDHCLRLAQESGNAFDPTVGPLVNLWGFGPTDAGIDLPSDAEITAALRRVGHGKVEARHDPPGLRKSDVAVYLDLSAAAKGYGVDAVAELLEERGFDSYLVEIGGEIRTRGHKPDGSPWRIGVEAPDPEGRRVQRVIEPGDAAVATSGDYRNFFEHEGVRYSHTIDPATGRPVTHDLATVTVLADTCLEADGLATALLVLGPERGYDWAVERGVAALFVSRDGDDRLTERTTPAWDERLGTTPLPSPLETAP